MILLNNFLSREECSYFIQLIDKNNQRSSVAGGAEKVSTQSNVRTSHTSSLPDTDVKVNYLKKKIAAYLGYPIEKGEGLQGQLYNPGEYFKPHTDYFDPESYKNHCMSSGNRTDTFMIYLNEDMEGGETNFTQKDISITPETGKAVTWRNLINGEKQYDTLHEGSPVTKGKKYIITSWWRENTWDPANDSQNITTPFIKNTFKDTVKVNNYQDLPRVTKEGFKVVKCPTKPWNIIKETYDLLKHTIKEEVWPGKDQVIKGEGITSDILNLEHLKAIRQVIHEQLQPLHKEWSNREILPTAVYGIRSYNKGATLITHRDKVGTHHISSIIIVDKDLNCGCSKTKGVENDWALDIQDHEGKWHKVYAEIGDIILYESAVLEHGRLEPFKGNYFRNFYVHYKLDEVEYVG